MVSLKALVPTVTGIVVGIVLLVSGEHDTGVAVLLAAVGFGGISAAAPPAPKVTQADVNALSHRRR